MAGVQAPNPDGGSRGPGYRFDPQAASSRASALATREASTRMTAPWLSGRQRRSGVGSVDLPDHWSSATPVHSTAGSPEAAAALGRPLYWATGSPAVLKASPAPATSALRGSDRPSRRCPSSITAGARLAGCSRRPAVAVRGLVVSSVGGSASASGAHCDAPVIRDYVGRDIPLVGLAGRASCSCALFAPPASTSFPRAATRRAHRYREPGAARGARSDERRAASDDRPLLIPR